MQHGTLNERGQERVLGKLATWASRRLWGAHADQGPSGWVLTSGEAGHRVPQLS